MALSTEAIYAALFARLRSKVGTLAVTYRRDYEEPDQIPAGAQPALLLVSVKDTPETPAHGVGQVWSLGAMVVVYARAKGQNATPETVLRSIRDAVEGALELQSTESAGFGGSYHTTLGGLVRYARISGDVTYERGEDTGQAAVLIPIDIRAVS